MRYTIYCRRQLPGAFGPWYKLATYIHKNVAMSTASALRSFNYDREYEVRYEQ